MASVLRKNKMIKDGSTASQKPKSTISKNGTVTVNLMPKSVV